MQKVWGRFDSIKKFTVLSLPPEASSWWSVLHFSPHTSCLCPCSRLSDWSGGVRTSLWRIIRSRLPDDNWSAFHANAPVDTVKLGLWSHSKHWTKYIISVRGQLQRMFLLVVLVKAQKTCVQSLYTANALTNSGCVSFQGKESLPSTSIPDLNIAFVSPYCHKVTLKTGVILSLTGPYCNRSTSWQLALSTYPFGPPNWGDWVFLHW